MGRSERTLKVLHVDPERAWGGGERQVMGLLKYLSVRGHRSHLLCQPDAPLSEQARQIGIPTMSLCMRNDLDPRPALRFRRLVQRESYDIIHFHTKRAHTLALWLGGAETQYASRGDPENGLSD